MNTTSFGAKMAQVLGNEVVGASIDSSAANATVYTTKISTRHNSNLSNHFVWASGSATTTVTLWMSNYADPSETDDTDWVQDTTYTAPSITGASGKAITNSTSQCAAWYRLKFVTTGGSATVSVWAHTK